MMPACTEQTFLFDDKYVIILVPEKEALKKQYDDKDAFQNNFPFWAKVWPASIALSHFINSHRYLLHQKKVKEIAAGLALPSLLAAHYAKEVICTDAAPSAIELMKSSVKKNGLKNVTCQLYNWADHLLTDDADVLLMSDVNYNPADFPVLLLFIESQLKKGKIILLSTPQRLMAKPFIEDILHYIILQEEMMITEQGVSIICSVFILQSA